MCNRWSTKYTVVWNPSWGSSRQCSSVSHGVMARTVKKAHVVCAEQSCSRVPQCDTGQHQHKPLRFNTPLIFNYSLVIAQSSSRQQFFLHSQHSVLRPCTSQNPRSKSLYSRISAQLWLQAASTHTPLQRLKQELSKIGKGQVVKMTFWKWPHDTYDIVIDK